MRNTGWRDASERAGIREERRRRLPVLGSCRAADVGRLFLSLDVDDSSRGERDAADSPPIAEEARNDVPRRVGPSRAVLRPGDRKISSAEAVRLSPANRGTTERALRCRERWCYRAMVPIPPNGPTPPSSPFALVLDLSSPPPRHLPPYLPPTPLSLFLFTYNCILTPLLTSTSAAASLGHRHRSPVHPQGSVSIFRFCNIDSARFSFLPFFSHSSSFTSRNGVTKSREEFLSNHKY